MIPSRNDPVTIPCPVCGSAFIASGKRRYCRDAYRVTAHRRRHQPDPRPAEPLPPAGRRRAHTIYECGTCGTRTLGEQRCADCGTFTARVGYGGLSPCCDEPLTFDELLAP